MNGVNALIAQGGRNQPGVLQKYVSMRDMVNRERRGALAEQQAQVGMQATRQGIDIAERKQVTEEQKQQMKVAAAYMRNVTDEASYKIAANQLKSEHGIDSPAYDQRQVDALQMAVYGPTKGKRRNMLLNGNLVPGIERETGEVVNPTTGQAMPTATIAPTRQETGEPGSFGLEGKGQRDKDKVKAIGEMENLYGLSHNVNSIIDTISNSPDYVGGATGTIINALNSAQMQMKQAYGAKDLLMPGGKFNAERMGNLSKENINWVRKAAIEGSRVDSAVLELAFTHAKLLNNSGKISDADVRFAREIIEGTADKAIKIEKLQNLIQRGHGRYEASRKARAGSEMQSYWKDIPMTELLPGGYTGAPAAAGDQEVDAMVDDIMKGLQ